MAVSNPEGNKERPPRRTPPLGRPSPYGEPAAIEGMGGVAAPLLAGFSIALLGLVLQIESHLRWPNLALLLLASAGVMLLTAVQYAYRARRYVTTPSEAADWYPEFDQDPPRQASVYEELRAHHDAHLFWARRARTTYNLAIGVLLLGLAVALVPKATVQPLRSAAIVAVLLGLLLEILQLVAGWLIALGRPDRLPFWLARAAWWASSGDPLLRPIRRQPEAQHPGTATPD
jgi:hypothetical protein